MQYLMHHLLRDSAARYPDKDALVQGKRRYTYAELQAASIRLAGMLKKCGISRGGRVGVFLDHSLDQVFSFYGALAAGNVYVPINSLLLGDQVDHIARDCALSGLIVDQNRLDRLKGFLEKWDFLKFLIVEGEPPSWIDRLPLAVLPFTDAFRPAGDEDKALSVADTCIGSDLAALLYTSGSTGRPKGVMVTHDNLIAGARIVTTYLNNDPDDRLLGVLPLTFDAGLNQVTCSAALGMTYVMRSFRFPGEIVDTLIKERITGFAGIPTVWHLLLQIGSPVHKNEFPYLRYITNTGGALPVETIHRLEKALPGTDIILMYGLTESFRSTYLPPEERNQRPTSIGKAIPGCEILVVGRDGKPCGPDEPGILVHRGPTVSMGYWGNPKKTAEVFRPHPFPGDGGETAERVVYSGDLVKKDEEGYLYFIGRQDAMIKCHGHRISPSEIEEMLYASGRIKLAAAIGLPDPVRGQSIKLFIVPQAGEDLEEKWVFSYCIEKLPTFMQPRFVEIREDLPRTGSGKIDIPALRNES